jgi:hypothetical protein
MPANQWRRQAAVCPHGQAVQAAMSAMAAVRLVTHYPLAHKSQLQDRVVTALQSAHTRADLGTIGAAAAPVLSHSPLHLIRSTRVHQGQAGPSAPVSTAAWAPIAASVASRARAGSSMRAVPCVEAAAGPRERAILGSSSTVLAVTRSPGLSALASSSRRSPTAGLCSWPLSGASCGSPHWSFYKSVHGQLSGWPQLPCQHHRATPRSGHRVPVGGQSAVLA